MLENKNAVITGANRGIGRATVEVFASNGANVCACARAYDEQFESEMAKIGEKYDVDVTPVYFDLCDFKQIKEGVINIKKKYSGIDILANVAGMVGESSSFMMLTIDEMKKSFDVNFWGNTMLTQMITRIMMRKHSGSIINVSSIASFDGTPAQYEYASSKAAVNGAVRQLSRELWQYGIRVNAVAPGIIETDMSKKIDSELKQRTLQNITMQRFGSAKEVANMIAFLGSDLASYITGQIIRVDGGM